MVEHGLMRLVYLMWRPGSVQNLPRQLRVADDYDLRASMLSSGALQSTQAALQEPSAICTVSEICTCKLLRSLWDSWLQARSATAPTVQGLLAPTHMQHLLCT